MDSACVYEQQTVINELTQGIQMAKELRANLNSAEARQFFIQKILSSYENALSVLKSGDTTTGQPWGATLPAQSLPDSSISNASPQSGEFELDQSFYDHQGQNDVVSRKRKGLTAWKDQVRMCTDNLLEMAYDGKRACNQGVGLSASSPPPPPSPEKYEIKPTHNHQLYHDLSVLPPPSEALSNLKANNLSVNTSDFCSTVVPSIFSIPSNPFGFMEDFQLLHFPNNVDDELLQVYSPPFISPDSSESNYFPEWGSSQSLDFSADVDPDFEFSNSFFLDKNDDPKFCRQVSWIGTLPF